ncbi:MAG: efflux RND transporter permease subunit, partial [Acidimicrobiia bacterium]|nr:efflux RND transporter permease subunit [Acidimicrobiia bacterium]
VDVTVSGRGHGAVTDDIRSALQEVAFPQEYRADVLNPSADSGAGQRLWLLAVAMLGIIYLLLQATFGGWRLSLGIMISAVAALFGAVVGAVLTGGDITMPVLFGLLAVLGLSVRHSMLIVDRAQNLALDEPNGGSEPIQRAVKERVPAMMTTLAMVTLIVVPSLLLGSRPGLELLRPMAVVVLLGLVTSLLATLTIVPAVYQRFHAGVEPDDPIDLRTIDLEAELAQSTDGDGAGGNGSGASRDEAAVVAGGTGDAS